MPPLKNATVLVTRPEGLQRHLVQLLEDAGARPRHIPTIAIVPPRDDSSRQHAKNHYQEYDIAIFISPTTVARTLQYMPLSDSHCKLAAIGSRSQQALEAAGLEVAIQPQGHDSESLLQHPGLQADAVAGRKILIFRGEDGRDILADVLQQRGARVTYAAMYNRVKPDTLLPADVLDDVDAVTISSNEGLQNLYDMVEASAADTETLLHIPVFVPGKRAQTLAANLGFHTIVVAANATDPAMVAALQQHPG